MLTDKNGREIKVGAQVRVPEHGVKTVVALHKRVIEYSPPSTKQWQPTPQSKMRTITDPATCLASLCEVADDG